MTNIPDSSILLGTRSVMPDTNKNPVKTKQNTGSHTLWEIDREGRETDRGGRLGRGDLK